MFAKRAMLLLGLFLGSVLLIAGIAATQDEKGTTGSDGLIAQQAHCYSLAPYTNTSGAPETYLVTASDNCNGQNSILVAGGIRWIVPDGGSITVDSIILQHGQTVKVNCKGSGGGGCNFSLL